MNRIKIQSVPNVDYTGASCHTFYFSKYLVIHFHYSMNTQTVFTVNKLNYKYTLTISVAILFLHCSCFLIDKRKVRRKISFLWTICFCTRIDVTDFVFIFRSVLTTDNLSGYWKFTIVSLSLSVPADLPEGRGGWAAGGERPHGSRSAFRDRCLHWRCSWSEGLLWG